MSRMILYFGCIRESGHYMWDARGRKSYHDIPQPWGYSIDGKLCPPGDPWAKNGQPQGSAALHHKDGWTALAFWDRTVDSRPGSNSAFLADETLTFEQLLERAKEAFPQVFARFTFNVVPAIRVLGATP